MSGPLRVKPAAWRGRPLLLFVSDLHLTDELAGPRVAWERTLERFWQRIAAVRGEGPAELVIVGDFIDIVRSPRWLLGEARPYHDPGAEVARVVDEIIAAVVERERAFFDAIRTRVQSGALKVHYVVGNHDRLILHAPAARRRLWKALTGEDRDIVFPTEKRFARHGVLAYHGHVGDPICWMEDGSAPVSDIYGAELIVRFPNAVRDRLGQDLEGLDDIDDVRPIYAVPAWIRQLARGDKTLLKPVGQTWSELVEEFLENTHYREWSRSQRRVHGIHPGAQLGRLLRLSTGKVMRRGSDSALVKAFRAMQTLLDGRMANRAAERLQEEDNDGIRFVVNGHSHFPSMLPLGQGPNGPYVYFNTGTWRRVHQIGARTRGPPAFLPYHGMAYVAFFPDHDELGRDFEWWTGAMVSREDSAGH